MRVPAALDADAIVVGAGISGLCCAWGLQQRGVNVLLLEAGAQAGGCISTWREDGYLLEGGPNSALDTSPLVTHLFEELGIAAERINANPHAGKRFVVRGGRPIALPMSPISFLTSPLFSARAKLRLMLEPFVARSRGLHDESVAEFVRRRIGREFLDYAINPFVGGVYAGRPEQLSVRAAFPRLFELEQTYGSLIRGQIMGARRRAQDPQKSKHAAKMFSFKAGMATLPLAVAQHLKRVEFSTAATRIDRRDGTFIVTANCGEAQVTRTARAVVLAVPAYAAAPLIAQCQPEAAAALAEIHYPPVTVAYCGYRRDTVTHALDGFGMLAPECEKRRILGAIFSSTLFGQRADPDHVLLTAFIGGSRAPELALLDDRALHAMVEGEMRALLGTTTEPAFFRLKRWQRAIPQYTQGHVQRLDQVKNAETCMPGLRFCANYRGGISISDCIQAGARSAIEVAEMLP